MTSASAAPRSAVFGIVERGREVLTFVPGTIPWPARFHLLDDDRQLRDVARLIREFHDAVTGFTPPPGARWQALMPADGDEIIAHHDLAPWNLVIGDRHQAFIDWDTAAPGTRLWDLAYAVHGFVPLSADPAFQRADAGRLLRLMSDAYGPHRIGSGSTCIRAAPPPCPGHAFLPRPAGRPGGTQPWARLWQEGHGDAWRADTRYIEQRGHQWRQALLG